MSNSASPSRNILIPFDTHITARHPESVEPSVFLLSLAYFHQRLSRDLPIPPLAIWPSSRDKILDLYKLYCLVLRLGGITVVCRDELWNILLDEFSEAKNEEEKEKDRHFLKRAYWEYLCTYEMYAEWCRGYVRHEEHEAENKSPSQPRALNLRNSFLETLGGALPDTAQNMNIPKLTSNAQPEEDDTTPTPYVELGFNPNATSRLKTQQEGGLQSKQACLFPGGTNLHGLPEQIHSGNNAVGGLEQISFISDRLEASRELTNFGMSGPRRTVDQPNPLRCETPSVIFGAPMVRMPASNSSDADTPDAVLSQTPDQTPERHVQQICDPDPTNASNARPRVSTEQVGPSVLSPLNRERSQCSESTEAEQQHFPSEPSTPPKQYSFPIPTTPNSLSTINTASLELNDLRPYQCSIGRESPPGHNRLRSSHHVRSAPLISGYYDNAPYTFDWDMERQKTSPVNMKDIEEEARSRAPGWWRGPRSIPLPVDIIEKITTAKVLFTERLENEEQEEYGLVSERSNPIVEGSPGAEYRPQPTVCTPIAAPIVHIPRPSGGPYGISEPLLPELGDDRPSRTASPPPPPAPKHVVPVARLPKLRVSFVPAPSNQTGRTPTLNLITPLPSKVPSQKGIPAQSLRPPVPASALPTMLQPSVAESSLAVHHPVPQGPRAKPGSSLQPQQTSTDHPYVTPRSRKRECLRCSKQQLREEDPELRHAEISYAVRLWYKYPIRMRSTDINYGLPLPCIPETKGAMATKKRRLQFGNSPYEDTTSESDSSYDHPLLRRRQGSISPIASDENNLGSKGQKSIFNIKKLKTVREKSTPIKGAEAGNVGRMRMKISESSMISMTERGRVNAAVEGNQQEGVIRNGVGSISSDLTMGMATESFVSNPFNEDEGVGEGRVIELFSGTSSNPAPAPSQRLEQLFDQAVDRNHDPKGKGKARGGRF